MPKPKAQQPTKATLAPSLYWHKAQYHFHTYAYRDPRSAFASGAGSPVVSPTTVLLGIVSTLFAIGEAQRAQRFLAAIYQCEILVDAPDGIVFFRAFHQLRRYETLKYGANPRFGLTKINQGTRGYGLVDGRFMIYVGAAQTQSEDVQLGLENLRHLGTSDSLCSLEGAVSSCERPEDVVYTPREDYARALQQQGVALLDGGITMVTLSRFKRDSPVHSIQSHWHLAGGADTDLTSYVIRGFISGTTRGKIYRKHHR